uniref:Uncharacterized protein n=1 Tax=Ciona savignyi TaxID=51511 RepID=H2ZAH9_CIOSA
MASRPVITAAIVGSLVCGLLLSVALGCLCKLYTLRAAARNRLRRDRPIAPTPLGRIARVMLRREAPPSYNMAVEGMDDETHDSSRRSTRSSRRRNGRRRSRHRNREPTIRRAQPSENRDSTNNNRGDSTEITTAHNEDNTQAVLGAPTSDPFVGGTNILVSLGLTEIQAAVSQATPSTSRAREASTSSRSRKDPEQAGPLPSKKKIAPVRVGAPCDGEMTADIAGCVYPNPPSYHEVVGNTPDQLIQTIAPEDRETLNPSPDDVDDDVSAKPNQRKSRNFWRRPFRGLFRSTHDFQ